MVEPLLNMGLYLQAIHRVHRIGQTKPTTVHRFVVNNSIESKIIALGEVKARQYSEGWRANVSEKDHLTVKDFQQLL